MSYQATSMQEISADRSNEHIKITLNKYWENITSNVQQKSPTIGLAFHWS